jgi:hypothetical protein
MIINNKGTEGATGIHGSLANFKNFNQGIVGSAGPHA